jgi:hypothetical protein
VILDTTKFRYLHVFTLTCMCIWICDLVYGYYVVYVCDEYCEV